MRFALELQRFVFYCAFVDLACMLGAWHRWYKFVHTHGTGTRRGNWNRVKVRFIVGGRWIVSTVSCCEGLVQREREGEKDVELPRHARQLTTSEYDVMLVCKEIYDSELVRSTCYVF